MPLLSDDRFRAQPQLLAMPEAQTCAAFLVQTLSTAMNAGLDCKLSQQANAAAGRC